MIKMSIKNTYIADFETLTGNEYRSRTFVWAWAICSVDNTDKVEYGTSINDFFSYIQKLKSGSWIGFHNLKWDGNFILHWLINHDFRKCNDPKLIPYSFSALVSDQGMWYSIRVKFQNKEFTFFDTLKKLPFSVAQIAKSLGYELKGEIDYTAYRSEGDELSEEDKDYMRRDVQIIAKALKEIHLDNNMNSQTIGSDCLKWYKKSIKNFKELYPILPKEVDEFCRKAFHGGKCYVNPLYQNIDLIVEGATFDNNSMYSGVMHSQSGNCYPIGEPKYYTGLFDPTDERYNGYNLYIQHFKATFTLKEGRYPSVQIKKDYRFKENEYLTECLEEVDFYMTNIDLDVFFKNYTIQSFKAIDGYCFRSLYGLFDSYINYWYNVKREAKAKGDKVNFMLAKLMLNNLFGKFSQSENANTLDFETDENDILKSSLVENKRKTIFIPTGCFITAYSRRVLDEAMHSNYDSFCYCDTDSIHLMSREPKGIIIDNEKLGDWKHESNWTRAKFLRQKTYCEQIDGKYEYKACGMPDNIKADLEYEDFKIGAVFNGKMTQKNIPGGVILKETTFKIEEP